MLLFILGAVVALVVIGLYTIVYSRSKHHRPRLHHNVGSWYFGYVPGWVVRKLLDPHARHGYRESGASYRSIESFGRRVRGRYYEYSEVVVVANHTHDNAIVKRRLHRR